MNSLLLTSRCGCFAGIYEDGQPHYTLSYEVQRVFREGGSARSVTIEEGRAFFASLDRGSKCSICKSQGCAPRIAPGEGLTATTPTPWPESLAPLVRKGDPRVLLNGEPPCDCRILSEANLLLGPRGDRHPRIGSGAPQRREVPLDGPRCPRVCKGAICGILRGGAGMISRKLSGRFDGEAWTLLGGES